MAEGYINTEAIWFRIISVLVVGFFLALFIANAIYWDRIVKNTCNAITKGEAQTLFWFNVIWAVIASIFFLWAIIRLFFHSSARTEAATKVKHYVVAKSKKAQIAAKTQLARTDVGIGRSGPALVTTTTHSPVSTHHIVQGGVSGTIPTEHAAFPPPRGIVPTSHTVTVPAPAIR